MKRSYASNPHYKDLSLQIEAKTLIKTLIFTSTCHQGNNFTYLNALISGSFDTLYSLPDLLLENYATVTEVLCFYVKLTI